MPLPFPRRPMRTRILLRAMGVLALVWPATAGSQPMVECSRNPNQSQWFVRAGAAGDGTGTESRPFGSLADVERCAPAGATITVLAALDTAPPLNGGIRLKDRQKLLGVEPARGARPVVAADQHHGSGGRRHAGPRQRGRAPAHRRSDRRRDSGRQLNGAILRDLLVTERSPIPRSQLDPSLCRVVRTGGAVDNAQSVLRGCTGNQVTATKGAIVLLADDRAGAAALTYTLQRVMIQDDPSHETPEFSGPQACRSWRRGASRSCST